MRQVVVIHGGDSFETYEEYLQSLRDFPIELEGSKGWKSGLGETLGPEYQVILPRMPNAMNARYLEWKLWFEKYIPLLHDGVILVGHSLGGSFLAKYLSTETFPRKIAGTFLIAPPFDTDTGRKLIEFNVPPTPSKLSEQGGEIFLYHSTDDPIVEYAQFEKFESALPNAHARSFTDRGHFLQDEFPKLVADIKSLG